MDENELQQNLQIYKAQLSQVEQARAAAGDTEELNKLVTDLKELIELTEGSLLSLKKSKLLKTLEDAESLRPGLPPPSSSMDDEYAAFQAALQDEETEKGDNPSVSDTTPSFHPPSHPPPPHLPRSPQSSDSDSGSSSSSSSSSSDSEEEESVALGDNSVSEELSKLVGTKCCAPFSHDWGKLDYHNALVMSAGRDDESDKIMVKVIYTTPTHNAMKPCQFYLDGHCKFNDDKCRYSHGQTVALDQLRDFVEVDHSSVRVDTKCLARYKDDIWYPATVTDVQQDVVSVHFDDYGEDMDLDFSQLVPRAQHSPEDEEKEDDEPNKPSAGEGSSLLQASDEEEEEELPHFLWQPPQSTAAVGEWEIHTRGIGSKLMQRMGYVAGQGLGRYGQGKAEPVPIMLLPQGKSLDRIMELKELAGNQDLFNAMKKLERQQRRADAKRQQADLDQQRAGRNKKPANVFDFLNTRLTERKGHSSSGTKSGGINSCGSTEAGGNSLSKSKRDISEHELHKKTDKDINVQVFKTHEEIRNVKRQMERLREQLTRNENKDRRMAAQVKARLEEQEAYLHKLQSSSSALEKHQKRRFTSKKLTIF